MAKIMRGDEPCAGRFGESQKRFVVGIRQARRLRRRELNEISGLTDGIEKLIHFLVGEPEYRCVALDDFFLLEQQVIAEHEPPFAASEPFEDGECRAPAREQGSEDHACVEHGTSHWRIRV